MTSLHKNGFFTQLFFDEEVVAEVLAAATLTFCPGLVDAMQAAAPPSIDWFKALLAKLDFWGVYVLILGENTRRTMHLHRVWNRGGG